MINAVELFTCKVYVKADENFVVQMLLFVILTDLWIKWSFSLSHLSLIFVCFDIVDQV